MAERAGLLISLRGAEIAHFSDTERLQMVVNCRFEGEWQSLRLRSSEEGAAWLPFGIGMTVDPS